MESYLTYPIAYPNYCFATSDNLEGAETYSTTPVFEDYTNCLSNKINVTR